MMREGVGGKEKGREQKGRVGDGKRKGEWC